MSDDSRHCASPIELNPDDNVTFLYCELEREHTGAHQCRVEAWDDALGKLDALVSWPEQKAER